jgi:uncharacterized protein
MNKELRPFHLAFPVSDLEQSRNFYGQLLGFAEGRSSERWIDWNFYGHQVVTHLDEGYQGHKHFNAVEGHAVPVPHFGVVLEMADWRDLRDALIAAEVDFIVEPHIRFEGEVGEQATLFFLDPSGNALEFKAMRDTKNLFEK